MLQGRSYLLTPFVAVAACILCQYGVPHCSGFLSLTALQSHKWNLHLEVDCSGYLRDFPFTTDIQSTLFPSDQTKDGFEKVMWP